LRKIKVGVLGATGTVGQRFVELLEKHPFFELSEVCASEKSRGKTYLEAVQEKWKIKAEIPERIAALEVKDCSPKGLDCEIAFSALDSSVAGSIEEDFANAGFAVSSNSKNHRMDSDVPLLVPEVNYDHLEILNAQRQRRNSNGFIITNPNCSTAGLVIPLKPLDDSFRLDKVNVVTMQALSGAGYPGNSAIDLIDNVYPFISGEEEKMETEPQKILGKINGASVKNAAFKVSAQCNRVFVSDGHFECVTVELEKKPSIEEIIECFESFNPLKKLNLPSKPEKPIIVMKEKDRPQPRLDRDKGDGMSVCVGRIKESKTMHYSFNLLSHNTLRGAAMSSILNAELLAEKGFV